MIRIIYLNIAMLALGILSSNFQAGDREQQVKAVFLFNLAQFVEWPPSTLAETSSPLIIGVLGANPFGNYLDQIVSGENVNGHPLLIRYYQNADEAKTCHIVFINFSEKNKMGEAIAALKDRSILTVSDRNNFISQGGMVKLVKKNNKIGIIVNTGSTKEGDLIISSKLLRIADVVH
jgi:hypothetical protein